MWRGRAWKRKRRQQAARSAVRLRLNCAAHGFHPSLLEVGVIVGNLAVEMVSGGSNSFRDGLLGGEVSFWGDGSVCVFVSLIGRDGCRSLCTFDSRAIRLACMLSRARRRS